TFNKVLKAKSFCKPLTKLRTFALFLILSYHFLHHAIFGTATRILNEHFDGKLILILRLCDFRNARQVRLDAAKWARVDAHATTGKHVQLVDLLENKGVGLVQRDDDGDGVSSRQTAQTGDDDFR